MEDRLRKFARLVDSGSYTKAASALHVSQPALTNAIQKLERELRVPLIERRAGSLRPTPGGQIAYRAAKALDNLTDSLAHDISSLADTTPPLALGFIDSMADLLFSNASAVEQLIGPADNVTLAVHNSRYLQTSVSAGDITAAVIAEQSELAAHLQQFLLGLEPLVVVCHPTHVTRFRKGLHQHVLNDFLSYDQPSNTHRLIQQAATRAAITLRPIFHSTSPEIIARLVRQGYGCAALPYGMVQNELDQGSLCRISLGRSGIVDRPISYVCRRGHRLDTREIRISDHIRSRLQHLHELARQH